MKKIDILYLSQKEVIEVGLTMKDAIAIVEDVLREHGLKHFENPPKPGIHPLSDAFIRHAGLSSAQESRRHEMGEWLSGKL